MGDPSEWEGMPERLESITPAISPPSPHFAAGKTLVAGLCIPGVKAHELPVSTFKDMLSDACMGVKNDNVLEVSSSLWPPVIRLDCTCSLCILLCDRHVAATMGGVVATRLQVRSGHMWYQPTSCIVQEDVHFKNWFTSRCISS